MEDKEKIAALSEALVAYATRSNDILPLVEGLPESSHIPRPAMEYEMRMLKILSVGWGLAFLLSEHPEKTSLSEGFWQKIALLSKEIDALCKDSGTEIDYFAALRRRLDMYVSALTEAQNPEDPGREVGLCYAKLCGDAKDAYAGVAGKRVFTGVLTSIQAYLQEHFGPLKPL
ncbi:hypothetical protein [Desulfobotulus sp.]|jgi:hypothetical protein|uniref:hypothetical protein n=1 Tax=Desulfobotulus sp. TaxID=1940337 RepID=UPI002A3706B2|nr:hypothetical protein [Desulfobotulus sp.]MDY0161780.1 hypothetical protein [Desulfobotulus sp.]